MIRLGVNIDHIATVRQQRLGRQPEIVAAAHHAVLGGADQITMHLREDRRHIQDRDLQLVLDGIDIPVNLEMAATDEMVGIACERKPAGVCLVPEKREELTTEGGLDVGQHSDAIRKAIERLHEAGIPVSVFIDPDEQALLAANEVSADAVEFHTGRYAGADTEARMVHEHQAIRRGAVSAHQLGLRVHAGHGLDYQNVERIAGLPEIEELNIGFAIVGRALFVGLTEAVREMRMLMRQAHELQTRGEA